MKFLLIGKGAREHAIAWKLKRSKVVTALEVWPGNIGMAGQIALADLPPSASLADLADYAASARFDAVVVGPETPLAEGLADRLHEKGIPCFGPNQYVAQLESSKVFAKDLMFQAGIPTAAFCLAENESDCLKMASDQLRKSGGVVLKASGLAGGKGVFVCQSEEDVQNGVEMLYSNMKDAAETVVIEELMVGRECSFFCFMGEKPPTSVGFAVDFKRLKDDDIGPNTGGMGCYTPVPWLPENAEQLIMSMVVNPLIDELAKTGQRYSGCLYVGVMWCKGGPKVVEFNVRLGDPEAQIIAAADDRDWGELIAFQLGLMPADYTADYSANKFKAAVGVVLASAGYPYGEGEKESVALPAKFLEENESLTVFSASVKGEQNQVESGNGRVLTVVGTGSTLGDARSRVYDRVETAKDFWPHVQFRGDIARRVVEKG